MNIDELKGRVYTIPLAGTAVTVAVDLAEIVVPANTLLRLRRVVATQSSDTDSEQVAYAIQRATSGYTSGSGGSAATFVKVNPLDAAATVTGEVFNSTPASAGTGTLTVLPREAHNIVSGLHYAPDIREMYLFIPTQACIISITGNPADSLTVQGYVVVEEFTATSGHLRRLLENYL